MRFQYLSLHSLSLFVSLVAIWISIYLTSITFFWFKSLTHFIQKFQIANSKCSFKSDSNWSVECVVADSFFSVYPTICLFCVILWNLNVKKDTTFETHLLKKKQHENEIKKQQHHSHGEKIVWYLIWWHRDKKKLKDERKRHEKQNIIAIVIATAPRYEKSIFCIFI